MVGPDGRETPAAIRSSSGISLTLSTSPSSSTATPPPPRRLERYRELVQATAEAMASMLHFDKARDCYVLGPPLWIARKSTIRPPAKIPLTSYGYWARGLTIAQEWRERLGLPRDGQWERMRTRLAPLPQKDGRYVALESTPTPGTTKTAATIIRPS